MSFSTGYALSNFSGTSIDEDGDFRGAARYSKGVSVEERQIFGGLDDNHTVNTATELLAMASVLGIQDVKKEDALKLYAEIAMEGATNKFFGVTGTTHEQVLARLKGKYNFTQKEIEGAIRETVAAVVDAEFGKISFLLENSRTNPVKDHNATLTYSSNPGYTLIYEGAYTTNGRQEITAPTLDALLAEMGRRKTDFDQTGINQVRDRATLIPAVVYASWKQKGVARGVDGLALIKETITNFFLNPNENTYKAILGIKARYNVITDQGDNFASIAYYSLTECLSSLSVAISLKTGEDIWNINNIELSKIPNDSRYDVFTVIYAIGGGDAKEQAALIRESSQRR